MVIISFVGYSFGIKQDGEEARRQVAVTKTSTNSTTTTSAPASTQTAPASSTGQYKDGAYTGSVADAFYGNIQVKAIISGGKLTDVVFLQYPNDRRDSVMINQQAMPMLKQEAVQAQSASVDGVSGATDTSQAFVESLTAALNKAV